ncbi:MAG: Co2+/Mg2+ efflux protein ApaG [Bacteroidia bacterium]
MIKALTQGVEISVKTAYSPTHSLPKDNQYFFTYTVTIENKNDFSIQLLSRHWHIYDSNGDYSQVQGEGVVGQQPVIEPNKKYTYTSGCNLKTEIGKMSGTYTMLRLFDDKKFEAQIPEFIMVLEAKMN